MYLFLFSLQVEELSKDDSNGKEGLIVFYFEEKTEKLCLGRRNSDFLITISSQHNTFQTMNSVRLNSLKFEISKVYTFRLHMYSD